MGDEHATVQQDEYGVRVNHQSEAVRLEAAEFLVATRAEQESRIRIARELAELRGLEEAAP